MDRQSEPIIIVGAGQAGGRAALALREQGYQGALLLIGDEPQAPYERPPLSKQVLLGSREPEQCAIGSIDIFQEKQICLLTGVKVERIRRDISSIVLDDGAVLPYGRLLLATGGRVRTVTVPGADLGGVHYLRTMEDARRLKARLLPAQRVVVVGGGLIGLEVAASACILGCEVTVLEAGERLAARALPPQLSDKLLQLHRARGVEVRLQSRIEAFSGTTVVTAVELEGGVSIPCDVIVVGVGIVPNVELAIEAGLKVANGIQVNRQLQTSDERIYAVGDVCEFPNPLSGQRVRMETWRNAEEQGQYAARTLLGCEENFAALPWFWSDQFDYGLQVAGEPHGAIFCVERQLTNTGLLIFFLNEQWQLLAAAGWGLGNSMAKDIKIAEMLIKARRIITAEVLEDPNVSLKSLLKASVDG